jgi:hypothetical protein
MKSFWNLTILATLAAALIGCRKHDAASELERAANAMAQADPAPASAPSTPQPSTPNAVPAQPAQAAAPAPAQELRQAMAAYKAGDLEDAVTRLQKLRATAVISPQQRMALQDSVAAVMGEIYGMAAKGDTRAIAAVKQYEHMQTMPH